MTKYGSSGSRKEKKGGKGMLPLVGLTLAVLLGVVAYVVAPPLVDFGMKKSDSLTTQFADFESQTTEGAVDYIAAALLWLVMIGLSALIVAAFIGADPEKEAWKQMGPSPSNKKAVAKAQKKQMKEAQKRLKKQGKK